MQRILRGGVAGIAATAAMSLVMLGGKALGLLGPPPPKHITAHAERKTGIFPARLPQPVFQASWLLAHLGYGAFFGAVYAAIRRLVPGPSPVGGSVFGIVLWAISYFGLLPALGLYPPPTRERPSQVGVMIAAHEVYGLTLAGLQGTSE